MWTKISMDYNKNLQRILLELKITQTDMAKILGISRQQFNNIINGRSSLTDKNILTLMTSYNVNSNYLLTGKGPMFLSSSNQDDDVMVIKLKKGQSVKIVYEE